MRMPFRSTILALTLTLGIRGVHALPATPQLSGTWVLNVAKSTSGPVVPPSLRMDIKYAATLLDVHRIAELPSGPSDVTLHYATDGTPSPNQFMQGPTKVQTMSVVKWSGERLTFETKLKAGEQEVLQTEVWSIAADGKTLTIDRSLKVEEQELKATLVFDRK